MDNGSGGNPTTMAMEGECVRIDLRFGVLIPFSVGLDLVKKKVKATEYDSTMIVTLLEVDGDMVVIERELTTSKSRR